MSIQIGQTLPDVEVAVIEDGTPPQRLSTASLFAHARVVLFAVPGAFTPTCSDHHLPGYVQHYREFRERGIQVIGMAVNDAYVMQAWAAVQQVPAGLRLLADGNASFTRALGLEFDGTAYGMGLRARRFALYAEDGVVRQLHVEAPGEFRVSTAEAVLQALPDHAVVL
ncbi:MAG: peroxiredoxin [Frateuria sp.]|uniref:peroxiredoxin n=1 Tax=Frateuria sp. TaxID=2211372 RepID=UPI0018576AD1|nr:peroxiredoxin [Frateuria sp.]NUO73092.1 peroxiredoxin [Frateuria sp.]NUR22519.1 peroxiredoxin [Frateuria sp.]